MVRRADALPPSEPLRFTAIDFETASSYRNSACSVGVVRVENGAIVAREHRLIRPLSRDFPNTWVHGITWNDVAGEPTFGDVWTALRPLVAGVDFIAAHNASFDRSVLRACCEEAGIAAPRTRFECTVKLARSALGIYPTKLHMVCERLSIPLRHHDALSDAEACAKIVLAARAAQSQAGAAAPARARKSARLAQR
ncbi:MAG: 3'-5' exonuclease [Planctomycetes bacterium]|nr:3'-5' exonuclease [Planctomycetota bacterium]